jgi:hypothetical protein
MKNTLRELSRLPTYLQQDTKKRMNVFDDYPIKYFPDMMYLSQISNVYPKEQVFAFLFAKKLESIVKGKPFGPN